MLVLMVIVVESSSITSNLLHAMFVCVRVCPYVCVRFRIIVRELKRTYTNEWFYSNGAVIGSQNVQFWIIEFVRFYVDS